MMPHSLIRISAVVTFVFASIALAESPDVAAALADRAAHYQPADYPSIYYLTLRPHVGDEAKQLERAMKFMIASNSRQLVLQRCVPVHIGGGVFRIDLRDLEWSYDDWIEVAVRRNKYVHDSYDGLVTRADRLVHELSDSTISDSYDRLFFGGKNIPKNRAEFQTAMGVINNDKLAFGLVEGQSGVNVSGTRRITWMPLPNGYYAYTEDSRRLDREHDPLENLLGNVKHDAEEHLAWPPKLWLGDKTHDGQWGVLMRAALFNGNGERATFAPVDIAVDTKSFLGHPQINYPASCIGCHASGAIPHTENLLLTNVRAGVDVFAGQKEKGRIEARYFSSPKTLVERLNADYDFAVRMTAADESTPQDVSNSLKAVLARYRAPLDLEQTAAELDVPVDQWRQTIATAGTVSARVASLLHGEGATRGKIPREAFEQEYLDAYDAMHGIQPFKVVEVPVVVEPVKEPVKPVAKPVAKPAPVRQQQNNQSFRGRR